MGSQIGDTSSSSAEGEERRGDSIGKMGVRRQHAETGDGGCVWRWLDGLGE
ncbi:hypothetical protein Droror1_Dr00008326, partial [Drosera rotundifolia]